MELNSQEMMDFISNRIKESGYTDTDLAIESNMHRVSIWKIRNKKISKIKPNNLKAITNALGIHYSIDDRKITFNIDTSKPIGGGVMADTTADKVIDHLMLENQRANETIVEMKKVVDTLKQDLRFKDELLTKNHVIRPNLDQNRMQCLVSIPNDTIKKGKYLDITTIYSKFLGYEPYELLGEEFRNHIHNDEHERIDAIEENPELTKDIEVWKVLHKDGSSLYVRAFGKSIETASGVLSVVDCSSITEDDYIHERSDSYYTDIKGRS